jgi:hypothetical protein
VLSCSSIGQNAFNFIYACTGPTRQYVAAGETLTFTAQTFAGSGGFFRAFVSGHYETVP